MNEQPRERVNYGWVISSGVIGAIFLAGAFVAQFWLGSNGAPVEALISVGTAIMLAAALYFLQRRFVVEVRQVATRTAEAVADARVTERVQEVNIRLDELRDRMNQVISERAQRQDAAVNAMEVPTFRSVAGVLAEANRLGAIVYGHVTVQGSYERDELGLEFSWGTDAGDQGQGLPRRHALDIRAHAYANERGPGPRWVIETTWGSDDSAEHVGIRLREALEKHGLWRSNATLDWPTALVNLQAALDLAIRSRRRDGSGWLQGSLYELVNVGCAITDSGVECAGYGVVVHESEFPDISGPGREDAEQRDLQRPTVVGQDLWDELLIRTRRRFPVHRGPFMGQPTWTPLTEPPD